MTPQHVACKKIILIANNEKIVSETVDNLDVRAEDLLILFNDCLPFKFEKIRDHSNKIVFIRKVSFLKEQYTGLSFLIKNKEFFKKILPCNGGIHGKEFHSKILNKLLFEKIFDENFILKVDYNYDSYVKSYMKDLEPYKGKPTTGFIGFCYANKIKNKEDNIILVGFDLLYGGKVLKGFHNGLHELKHYEEEEKRGNLIRISA